MLSVFFLHAFAYCLKGQCHEIFDPRFFHQTIPPRALIHGLSRFAYGFVFAEKIDSEIAKIGFRGLNETAETKICCQSSPLKGQCHKMFDPRFFSSNNPP
jgi:hypothetical protein